jgi:hypothetical protein
MPSKKGVKKPRISEYSSPRAVRFKKNIDRELAMFALDKDIRASSIIQAAVECFLRHPDCHARNKIVAELT